MRTHLVLLGGYSCLITQRLCYAKAQNGVPVYKTCSPVLKVLPVSFYKAKQCSGLNMAEKMLKLGAMCLSFNIELWNEI